MSTPKDWKAACFDPLCEIHNQPKPTGEWTVEHGKLHDAIVMGDLCVELPLAFDQSEKIAAAHNAAIAAVQWIADDSIVENVRLMNQLSAEREKVTLAKQMVQIESKRANEAEQQLAAERGPLVDGLADLQDSIEHADPANLSSRLRDKLTDVISDALAKAKLSDDSFVPEADQRELSKLTGELVARITEYFAVGGMFNPELMEHEKVRDLLMDCRAGLDAHNAAIAAERARYRLDKQPLVECLNYYAQDTGQGSTHEKARQLLIDMGLWPTKLAKVKDGKA